MTAPRRSSSEGEANSVRDFSLSTMSNITRPIMYFHVPIETGSVKSNKGMLAKKYTSQDNSEVTTL